MQQLELLKQVMIGANSLYDFTIALAVFLLTLATFKIIQSAIIHRLAALAQRTHFDIDELVLQIVKTIRFPTVIYVAFYLAALYLQLPETLFRILTVVLIAAIIYQAIALARLVVEYVVNKKMGTANSGQVEIATQSIGLTVQIVLWSLGILFILSNFGVDVTSLIAALGVGGIAIAFALQQILSDLFSSFAIYFDKPFVPGDFIVVGDKMGTVENIGIKTTRIKSLQGEELVFSNQELTTQPIQNYQRMSERRIVFEFGLDYATPPNKVKAAVEGVKNIIKQKEIARLDRVHFKQFGQSSLIVEAVYYVNSSAYNDYMDVNQEIMLEIQEMLVKAKIKIALPRQIVQVDKPAT